jgi:hypothetical protein
VTVARGLARRVAWGILAGAVVAAVAALAHVEQRAVATDLGAERDLHGAQHAGSRACRRCHEDHYRTWHRTFHRTMTQAVSPDEARAVLGDFSGDTRRSTLRYGGVVARMDRDAGGAFRMTFTSERDPARGAVTATISRAVGSRRYQQYLTRFGDAEYRLPVAFHVEEQRWFHMNGAFLFPDPAAAEDAAAVAPSRAEKPPNESSEELSNEPSIGPPPAASNEPAWLTDQLAALGGPGYARHVTRWNDNCVFCHNVAPNPARDLSSGAFRTEVAEMGIACEACHGPGAAHARANANPLRRYALHLTGVSDPTIVNPARLSRARAADVCGRCHGQRITDDIGSFLAHGDPFVPGDDLALWSSPLWQGTSMGEQPAPFAARFWADGTARLTAYEYQGLLQSPCTQRGPLTCTTCHGMHDGDPRGQLRPSAAASGGDGACTPCHRELSAPAAKAGHTHHAAAGAGANGVGCVDCHMPRIVYGVLDIHRSHRIELPAPQRADRPDACTLCHVEETRAWAMTALRRLWPQPADADVDADADGNLPYATILLSGDPIERAIAADALGRAPLPATTSSAARAARAGLLIEAMTGDDYPAVRHLAARALGRLLPSLRPALDADYDPTGTESARRQTAAQLLRVAPARAIVAPDPAFVRQRRGAAREVAIEIGE